MSDMATTTRAALSRAFLARAGWVDAARGFLAGDASNRSYDRLTGPQGRAVLMDAPPEKGEDVGEFLRIARHLTALGLSAPEVLAANETHGFLLLEDLGDDLYARVLERDPALENSLYTAATDLLVALQRHPAPAGIKAYDTAAMAEAATLATEWYRRAITGDAGGGDELRAAVAAPLAAHAEAPPVIVLRDYHAENLLWLPEREGLARVGLLDFQNAELGQPGYDLVSLLQDARRDVDPATEAAMVARFAAETGSDPAGFAAGYAALGAQRALRILGVFARLCLRDGKPGYVRMMPRVWGLLMRNLAHPSLAGLRAACEGLPDPTPEALARITAQCGTIPKP